MFDFSQSQVYQDFLRNQSYYKSQPNTLTFGTFYYKGDTIAGQCNDWTSFALNDLQLPFDDVSFTYLTAYYEYYDYNTHQLHQKTAFCPHDLIVGFLANALVTGEDYEYNCNDNSWRVFTCNGKRVICLNCKKSCVKSVTCPGTVDGTTNPCTSCKTHTAAAAILNWQYSYDVLYPEYKFNTTILDVNRTSVTFNMTLTVPGTIYCGAFPPGYNLTTLQQINSQGHYVVMPQTAHHFYFTIDGLSPDTDYNIYCYTSDFQRHIMPFSLVIQNPIPIRTLCCRYLSFTSTYPVVYTSNADGPKEFAVSLSSAPNAVAQVNLTIHPAACASGYSVDPSGLTNLTVVRSSLKKFYPSSTNLAKTFTISGYQGCYQVNAFVVGTDYYTPASIKLTIVNNSVNFPFPAPVLTSVRFSDDGLKIVFNFNVDTNTPTFGNSVAFACAKLMNFAGITTETCSWYSARQLVATLSPSSLVEVNGMIFLHGNTSIKAVCATNTDCTRYSFMTNTYVNVTAPSNPLIPVASLTTARYISYCDDVVLDTTSSTGNGGRRWKQLSLTFAGQGPLVLADQNYTQLNNYLAATFTDTNYVVTVTQAKLIQYIGAYAFLNQYNFVITLSLTNFLQQTSRISVLVNSVADNPNVPRVSIFGVDNTIVYRWQPVQLFAVASFGSCGVNVSSISLQYSWRVFNGMNYLVNVTNQSKDPRYFTLPAYTFDASSNYTFQVVVSIGSHTQKNAVIVSSSKTLHFGSSGIYAEIKGGSTQIVMSQQSIAMDASSSFDIDYPTGGSPLSYSWSCIQYTPNYGSDCYGFYPLNVVKWYVPGDFLPPFATYRVSVTVANKQGQSATASADFIVVSLDVPRVAINSTALKKFNPSQKIILTASVITFDDNAKAYWVSRDVPNLAAITNTPLVKNVNKYSSVVYQLSILPYSLTAGVTYAFQITSAYNSLNRDQYATATILVVMNAPPVGGEFTITPSSGSAVTQVFVFATTRWTDDPEDYPLTYVLSYYLLSPSQSFIIKNKNQISYATTTLGQGLKSNSFAVTGVAAASDIYGGTANRTTPVYVYPVTSTPFISVTATVINAATAGLSTAFTAHDPAAVNQVVGAALGTINSVDCTIVGASCAARNRQSCQATPFTCGPCLSGFVGVTGDSNIPCNVSTTLRQIGQSCLYNSSCISGACLSGVCVDVNKACPHDCYGKGTCMYYDQLGSVLESCSITNPYCQAKCQCIGSRFGRDCSLLLPTFNQLLTFRETLCHSMYHTLRIQDVSADVVATRAITLGNILFDINQITLTALSNCTAALVETIAEYPQLACQDSTLDLMTNALSNVLQDGSALPTALLLNVSAALSNLATGCQTNLAIGENPVEITTTNMRMQTSLQDSDLLLNHTFTSPLSDLEVFVSHPATTITVNSVAQLQSSTASLGVTMVQYNNNPQGRITNTSSVSLETAQYGNVPSFSSALGALASTTRRLSESAVEAPPVAITLVLPNIVPIDYYEIFNSTLITLCPTIETYDYYVNASCPDGLVMNLTCPTGFKGYYNVTCPGRKALPRCTIFDGTDYVVNPHCEVVAFDAWNTTCVCNSEISPEDFVPYRHLSSANSVLQQFSTTFELFQGKYAAQFYPDPPIVIAHFNKNILWSLLAVVALFVVGLLTFVMWDRQEFYTITKLKTDKSHALRTIQGFFNGIVPDEFRPGPWKELMVNRILLEHSWISMFSAYNEKRDLRSAKYILAFGRLISFLFVNTILSTFLYADDGSCDKYVTSDSCLSQRTVADVFKTCKWRPENDSCIYRRPKILMSTVLFLIIIVTLIAVPINKILEILVKILYDLIEKYQRKDPLGQVPVDFKESVNIAGEFPVLSTVGADGMVKDGGHSHDLMTGSAAVTLKEIVLPPFKDSEMVDMWRLKDELNDVQLLPAKCLKAARLRKIQKQADFELPSVEVERLVTVSNNDFKRYGRLELTVNKHQFPQYDLSDTVKHSRYTLRAASKAPLSGLVLSSRKKAEYIKSEMEYMSTNFEREDYLMKQFIVYSFVGYQRNIARRYFLGSLQSAKYSQFRVYLRYLSVLLIPAIFACMVYYTYVFNMNIGTRSVELWLLVTFLSLAEDIFFFQPMKIWLTWIVLNSYVSDEAYKVCVAMKLRFKSIMNRQAGMVRDAHSLVQHFNPACRAARLFPDLPVSRFLMSINDYDVPFFDVQYVKSMTLFQRVKYYIKKFILVFTWLPGSLQDCALELSGILMLNLLAIAFYLLGVEVMALAIVLAFLLILFFILRETTYWETMKKRKTMKSVARYLPRLKPPVSQTNKQTLKFEELNNDFDNRVLYKSKFNTVRDSDKEIAPSAGSNRRMLRQIKVQQQKSARQNAALTVGGGGSVTSSPGKPGSIGGAGGSLVLDTSNLPPAVLSPSRSPPRSMVPKIDTGKLGSSGLGTPFSPPREEMKSPAEVEDSKISDDEFAHAIPSEAEKAALKAKRKAAKKSKKRLNRLREADGGGGDDYSDVGGGGGSRVQSAAEEPDTGRSSQLNSHLQRQNRRKEKHRHKESEMGGPGISSARQFGESPSTVGGGGVGVHSPLAPAQRRDLMDLIRVDVNSELPQIDYFRGNNTVHSRTGNNSEGTGPGARFQTSQHSVDSYGNSTAYSRPQFPSWH